MSRSKNPLVDIEREKWRDTLRRTSDVVMIETCQLCIRGSLKHTQDVNHRMCERFHSGSIIQLIFEQVPRFAVHIYVDTRNIDAKNLRLMNVGVETSVCWDEIRREEKRTLVAEKSRSDSFADTITEQSLEKQIDYNVVSD